MRFRTGLLIGAGIGYVLGARAGRARYEQIRSASSRVWESPPGRMLRETATDALQTVQSKAFDMVRSITSGQPDHIDLTEFETDSTIEEFLG